MVPFFFISTHLYGGLLRSVNKIRVKFCAMRVPFLLHIAHLFGAWCGAESMLWKRNILPTVSCMSKVLTSIGECSSHRCRALVLAK